MRNLERDPVCPECIDEGHCMDCQGTGREIDGFPASIVTAQENAPSVGVEPAAPGGK